MAAHKPLEAQNFPEIAGYRLLRVLGEGGMSTVYLSQQASLGRNVAIKVMRPEAVADDIGRRRFENEARTIARLEHPHIVRIHEVGHTKDGLAYYVMPVLPRGHIGKRNLIADESRIREIAEILLSALGYAHSRGVIHRDVKAENVLFDEADRPMLTDFGIALRRGYGSRVTATGLAVGSTAYMAPEQARGLDVDHRADLYSLGVLIWEMLTGDLPYKAGDALSMALKHVQDPIPQLPPQLRHWQSFFDRALAKSAGERYPDAAEMAIAIKAVPHAAQQPMRAALARLATEFGGRRRRWLWATAAVAAVVAGLIVFPQLREMMAGGNTATPVASGVRGPSSGLSQTGGIDPTLGAPIPDPSDSLLRAAPESAAQRFIDAAGRQIQQRRLIAPADGNAYDSVLMAWRTDPTHMQLSALNRRVISLLSAETVASVRRGDDAAVSDLLSRIERLTERDREGSIGELLRLRRAIGPELSARMTNAEAKYDRNAAKRVVASARALGMDTQQVAALQARANKIAQPGDRIASQAGSMTIAQVGEKLVAIAQSPVSRETYAQFAKATQRKPALCRERASLLRVLAPRTWETPGFEQTPKHAVVCVSWKDAEAFARWQSQRSKERYRLPTAAEAQALARAESGKAVAEWLTDCGSAGCARRMAKGRSWRGAAAGSRPLDAERGYDDVGFRLVREL
jgi:serine/threonine-protein kinase PpkA